MFFTFIVKICMFKLNNIFIIQANDQVETTEEQVKIDFERRK